MDTTVIIAVKDRHRNIRYCLASISLCTPRPKEVIVVDFGSKFPVNKIARSLNFVRVVRVNRNTKKFHKARALNIGIKHAKTKFVCITDADQIFRKNFFGVVNSTLTKNPNSFVKCITYFLNNEDLLPSDPRNIMSAYPKILRYAKKHGRKPFGEGNCQGMLLDWVMSVRGHDERYIGWGYEDSNMTLRATRAGLRTTWVSQKTGMVHLPHPRDPEYFHMPSIQKSLSMFKNEPQPMVANQDIEWGQL